MKVALYIAGRRVDLADDSLILWNYRLTDVYNPAAVRNSYSQDVELPGTPANNQIFAGSFRVDKTWGFDASKRTEMALYSDRGDLLAAGYCKLNAITTEGGMATYSVTLYGGLGDFLYGLSYRPDGEKMSLADLDYLGGGDDELTFQITRLAVLDAWARLAGDDTKDAMWDVINFAPAYNGIPSDFAAAKAIGAPADIGLPAQVERDGKTYTPKNGYALINLSEDLDEWGAHDLRSYLQRPVLSMAAFFAAVARSSGWSVDYSDIPARYLRTWLTRPLLPSLGTFKQTTGELSVTYNYNTGTRSTTLAYASVLGLSAGSSIEATITFDLHFIMSTTPPEDTLKAVSPRWGAVNFYEQVLFVQLVGLDENDMPVAASRVKVLCQSPMRLDDYVRVCGFVPDANTPEDPYTAEQETTYTRDAGAEYVRDKSLSLTISGANVARIDVVVKAYWVECKIAPSSLVLGGTAPGIRLWNDAGEYRAIYQAAAPGDASGSYASADALRSGATITKRMLLSTSNSPADYLVSFCKMLGLYIVADEASRSVRILRRESFFQDDRVDLSGRIDRTRMEITPLAFDAKWYELALESVDGAFEKEYQDTEGVQYGIQRVDTGYDFDAESVNLLEGSALKSAASVRARGQLWCYYPGIPAAFRIGGHTFTYYDVDGSVDTDISQPVAAPTWYTPAVPGYDLVPRAEFRDKDNKGIEGADVLLLHNAAASMADFAVTDDIAEMDLIAGGPCWLFGTGGLLSVPTFSRISTLVSLDTGRTTVFDSLDLGVPRVLDLPETDYPAGVTIYARRWRDYLSDRLHVHTKILRCKADLRGLHIGYDLLRHTYYFRGCLWVLNAVENYSLTTFDPVEVELIQVRDPDNYTT